MSKPAEFIQPPNTLRLKVGGAGFGGIDAAAIARAEAALKDLSSQFGEWLDDEIVKLEEARAGIRAQKDALSLNSPRSTGRPGLATLAEYNLRRVVRAV